MKNLLLIAMLSMIFASSVNADVGSSDSHSSLPEPPRMPYCGKFTYSSGLNGQSNLAIGCGFTQRSCDDNVLNKARHVAASIPNARVTIFACVLR